MKKLWMLAATFALAIPAPVTLATPAQAASDSAVQSNCKAIVAAGNSGLTVGECVSLATTFSNFNGTGHGYAAQECSFAEQQTPDLFFSIYDSYSDCVQDGASTLIQSEQGGGAF